MKFSMAALFIAVVTAVQVVSCQGRYPRALRAKLPKKTKRKSSKRNVKKVLLPADEDGLVVKTSSSDLQTDEDDLVVNTSRSDLKTDEDDLFVNFSRSDLKTDKGCIKDSDWKGRNWDDDRSNGCWLGQCRMCLPQTSEQVLNKCYCARNAGVAGDPDVYLSDSKLIEGIFNTPIGGGKWYDRCRKCRRSLEADGVIAPGATCNRGFIPVIGIQLKSSLSPLWKNFGPPNHNDVIWREPTDCHAGSHCKLLCGKDQNNEYQMHIDNNPRNSENGIITTKSKVYGKFEYIWYLPFIVISKRKCKTQLIDGEILDHILTGMPLFLGNWVSSLSESA